MLFITQSSSDDLATPTDIRVAAIRRKEVLWVQLDSV